MYVFHPFAFGAGRLGQGVLQPVLRQGPAVCPVRRQAEPFRYRDVPGWLRSRFFRYGFLVFFMVMFCNMLHVTWLVFSGAENLRQVVTLLWVFKLPWQWAYSGAVTPWVAQFAFGFYSIMITSTVLGIISLLLWKPRSWCVYCPMGTMTQFICKAKHE